MLNSIVAICMCQLWTGICTLVNSFPAECEMLIIERIDHGPSSNVISSLMCGILGREYLYIPMMMASAACIELI
jgi:hypothetical protein